MRNSYISFSFTKDTIQSEEVGGHGGDGGGTEGQGDGRVEHGVGEVLGLSSRETTLPGSGLLAVGSELEAGGVGDGVADSEGLPPGAVVLVAGEATANVRVPV